jgi:flagellar motility protein MotE (MotC chaperone)
MSRLPRLLPLVAVAVAGVLAINAVENGPGVIGAARALAEGMAKGSKSHQPDAADAASSSDPASATSPLPPQLTPAKPAPVCAPTAADLAKEAGLSPAELQVLQSLGARRGELDEREQGLDTQVSLIAAAEAKVDARIAVMNGLKADMTAMLGQLDDKQQAEVDRLVKVFEAMKPADAAARFTLLTDDVRLPIAAKMKERALSAMLAKMAPPEAKRLTESLAARYVAQAEATRQAINPPQAPASAPAAAATPAKPAQMAQGAADATDAGAAAAAAPAKPSHRRPHTVHHSPAAAATAAGAAPAAPGAPGAKSAAAAPAVKPEASAAPSPAAAAAPAAAKPAPPAPPAAAAPAKPG